MKVNDEKIRIFCLFFISFLFCICISFIFYSQNGILAFYSNDTGSYINPAKDIIAYGTFGSISNPEIFRTPGYPLFLVPFLLIGENWELWVILTQAIFAGLTVVITYLTVKKIASEKASFFAGLILSLSPLVAIYSSGLLTELLCAFLLSLFCFFMVDFLKERKNISLCLSSIILMLAVFTRPAVLYLIYLMPLFILAWGYFSKFGIKKIITSVLLFSLFSITPVKAWEYRNKVLTDYNGFSSVSAMNLYFYNGASVLAKLENKSYYEKAKEMGMTFKNTGGESLNKIGKEGQEIITNNLLTYLPIHLKGMAMIIATPDTTDILRTFNILPQNMGFLGEIVYNTIEAIKELWEKYPTGIIITLFSFIYMILLYIFAFIGLLKLFSSNLWTGIFLLSVFSYMIFISGGPGGHSRFRTPIVFIIAVFVGIGIDNIWQKKF